MNGLIDWPTNPGWMAMWELSFGIFLAAKAAVLMTTSAPPAWGRCRAVFLFAWPGMDLETMLAKSPIRQVGPTTSEWLGAVARTSLGLLLVFVLIPHLLLYDKFLAGRIGMLGIIMILHFGVLHLLSCFWRARGFRTAPIMNRPLASESLSDFWGRRWNLAFRDLMFKFLFRPYGRRLGPHICLLVCFLVSGLIHDLVISWPAGGGYGGPTIYFLLQGFGILLEKSDLGLRWSIHRGIRGRMFCLAFVATPLSLLFHQPFLTHVICPFLEAMGAVR